MKKLLFAVFALIVITSFTVTDNGKKAKTTAFKVDTSKSKIIWTGKKVTGEHTGTVNLSSGNLVLDGKTLKSGSFEIDFSSLTVTDIKDADGNAKLLKHLKSDDFFSVEKNPTSKFVITSVSSKGADEYQIKGDLTIKGITNAISFPATVKNSGKTLFATAKIKVDRTKYDIKFRSTNYFENLGDKAISDDFDLNVNLVANQADNL
jgi:polyisoprenoid-binding protein YceI